MAAIVAYGRNPHPLPRWLMVDPLDKIAFSYILLLVLGCDYEKSLAHLSKLRHYVNQMYHVPMKFASKLIHGGLMNVTTLQNAVVCL